MPTVQVSVYTLSDLVQVYTNISFVKYLTITQVPTFDMSVMGYYLLSDYILFRTHSLQVT